MWSSTELFSRLFSYDIDDWLEKLIEYRLIEPPETTAATINEFLDWVDTIEGKISVSRIRLIKEAIRAKRKDILALLEVGKLPPVNRRKYWHNFYTSNLKN